MFPQTTTRSEPQPLEPLDIELETNPNDLVVHVEASQASWRARPRGSKNESTEVDPPVRVRHCPVHVQAEEEKEEVASLHHRSLRHRNPHLHELENQMRKWEPCPFSSLKNRKQIRKWEPLPLFFSQEPKSNEEVGTFAPFLLSRSEIK